MTILAVDPSSKSSGWCLVNPDGTVVKCGVVRATRIGLMASRIRDLCRDLLVYGATLAIERATPQTRKGIYRDLFPAGMAAGIWIAELQAYGTHDLLLVTPRDWRKAMIGKGHRGRDAKKRAAIQRANAELSASGLPRLDPAMTGLDDVAEAICIGVYAARRAKR